MTMRNHRAWLILATTLALVAFGGAGCATPGLLHVYIASSVQPSGIYDQGDAATVEVPCFMAPDETLTGFAYDPFTDHLFLRLAPGNRVRVVDRPARAIKREFVAEGVPTTGGGDLAVRPRDGHLFIAHPTEPTVVELSRFGQLVRMIPLAAASAPPRGIAYDSIRNLLLVVGDASATRVSIYDLDGHLVATIPLTESIAPGSLGYDCEKRALYAPLAGGLAVGVFDETGQLRRTIPTPARFVDVGPRSFLRLF